MLEKILWLLQEQVILLREMYMRRLLEHKYEANESDDETKVNFHI